MTDWSALTHAYGPADDVPEQLADLRDPERRERALWALYGNVFHQGTRYPATPYVVPELVALLRDGVAPFELLRLLTHLVAGYRSLTSTGLWCDGVTLRAWDGTTRPADPAEDLGYDQTAPLLAEIWRQGRAALPELVPFVSHEEARVRGAAAVLLSLYAGEPDVARRLRDRLAVEADGAVRADLRFAAGDADGWDDPGWDDPDPRVRLVCAVIGRRDARAMPVLVAALRADVPGFDAVVCARDSAASVAAWALGAGDRADVLAARAALCEALARTTSFDAVAIVEALLRAAFPTPLGDAAPDAVQREVLAAFVAHPHLWTIGNLWEAFSAAGVPQDRARVAARLGVAVPEDRGVQDVAQGLLFAGMGFPDKALVHLDRAGSAGLEAHPDRARAWVTYAELLVGAGRIDEAARASARAALWAPDPLTARLQDAVRFGRSAGYEVERRLLAAILVDHGASVDAWHLLGITLRHLDRFEDALAATDRALALDPEHRDAWWNRGSVTALLGRREEALAAVERCVALDPGVGPALAADADFDAVRDDPRFQRATQR